MAARQVDEDDSTHPSMDLVSGDHGKEQPSDGGHRNDMDHLKTEKVATKAAMIRVSASQL